MKLFSESGEKIETPSPTDVLRTIMSLTPEGGENCFAILEQAGDEYIQVMRLDDDEFHIEFRAGSADEHYEYKEAVNAELVIQLFRQYLTDYPDWCEKSDWARMSMD